MSRLRRIAQQDRIFFVTSNLARGAPNLSERERDVGNKLDYIHQNPVVAQLVNHADEWRWSSAAFYSKLRAPGIIPDIMDFSGDPDELLWPAPWRRK